jgi:hypothetical protein
MVSEVGASVVICVNRIAAIERDRQRQTDQKQRDESQWSATPDRHAAAYKNRATQRMQLTDGVCTLMIRRQTTEKLGHEKFEFE